MGLATVKAFARPITTQLTPVNTNVAGVAASSPDASAYIEFEQAFGIGSIQASVDVPTVVATGVPDPTDDFVVEILVQYFSGAVYDGDAADTYSGGSWIDLLPRRALLFSGTNGVQNTLDMNFEAPMRPPIDLSQSLLAQVRNSSNTLITNQKKRHFTTRNTHRHTYSSGITGDSSSAGNPFENHADFRIWARHLVLVGATSTYKVNVSIGAV